MKSDTVQNPQMPTHHWYDPLVEIEHKVEHVLEEDVDKTIHALDKFDRKVKGFSKRHPGVLGWVQFLAMLVLLAVVLFLQAHYERPI